MGFERLKDCIVPGFGELAIGDKGVDFRALPLSEQEVRSWSFDAMAQRQETIMLNGAIAFLIIAVIAGLIGFEVVGGTGFAAAKAIFVVALLAFLIWGVAGVTRRGAP
jgi:uncharacterized membrane protein YtjA (UPF0391 family)